MGHRRFRIAHILLIACLGAVATAPARAAEDLTLKRVMLSTGGVGYFEYEAVVDGDAELVLDVRLDQVDDVLKSIVVYDERGGVGTVSLPGREPLAQVFRDLPFARAALNSPVTLLNALQGAEVEAVGTRALRGRLVRVVPESRVLPNGGGTVTRHRVSLWTAEGLQHLIYEDAESLRFADPVLQAQVTRALDAIAAHRVRDKRRLRLTIKGEGRRVVRVAYVVGAPLWKASYRLTIGDASDEPSGLLHGWAVVENMSGQDWEEVELTLLSGNPVTFRQALYSAYFVHRPEVPVEVLGRILPRPDTGTVSEVGRRRAQLQELEKNMKAPAGVLKALESDEVRAESAGAYRAAGAGAAFAATAPAAPVGTAASEEAATQVIFRLPRPVSVAAGHSLMVPIVDRQVPALGVALYQPDTHAVHPLAAVRLSNDTGVGMPPGVITLYERSAESGNVAYVGDARLTTLPDGEERLLSFALDQKTRIDREVRSARSISKAAIDRGVLRLTVARKQLTLYRLKAPAHEDRLVLLEIPRRKDWELLSPDENVELTERHYRIGLDLAAGSERELEVVLERPVVEIVQLGSLPLPRTLAYARSRELGEEVRQAFARMADLQRDVQRQASRIEALQKRRRAIFEEQKRIRDNVSRVPRDSDLYRRYLAKLDNQETELEGITDGVAEATALRERAEAALAAFIRDLRL